MNFNIFDGKMDFRIFDGKFYLPLQNLKKSMAKDISKETKNASELVDAMIQFFIEQGISEIRKDEKTGKEYITINEEKWSKAGFGDCPKVDLAKHQHKSVKISN